MSNKQRLDSYLVKHGLVTGREKAKEHITKGEVSVNGQVTVKPAFPVSEEDTVICQSSGPSYVGRGALKLQEMLDSVPVTVSGAIAMDIGASTGGFTDCLLRHGADIVYAVDVGHDQLHPSLISDSRVVNLEGTDVRSDRLKAIIPAGSVDLLTIDVSFISLRQVLPYLFRYLKPSALLILLIKPQFEAGKAAVGKNGIVRDPAVHCRVLKELCEYFSEQHCCLRRLMASPITGGAGRAAGNIEYLALLSKKTDTDTIAVPDIRQLVLETFSRFHG